MLYCNKCQLRFEKGNFCSECGSPLQEQDRNEMRVDNNNKPRLEEILGWIKNKLTYYGVIESFSNQIDPPQSLPIITILEYNITNFDKQILQLNLKSVTGALDSSPSYIVIHDYVIDLSKLTLDVNIHALAKQRMLNGNSSIVTKKEIFEIELHSQPSQEAIILNSSRSKFDKDKDQEFREGLSAPKFCSSIAIEINDKNIAERMANAFHDAIELCGGKPELY